MISCFTILNLTYIILQTNAQSRNPWAHWLSTIFVGAILIGISKLFKLSKNGEEVKKDEGLNTQNIDDEVKLEEIKKDEGLKRPLEIDNSPKVISKTITITNSFFSKKTECIKLDFDDGLSGTMFHVVSNKYYYFIVDDHQYRYKNYPSCKNAVHNYLTKNDILKINFLGREYNSKIQ